MGAELEKGRNHWAETSGGQIRKGPKPLATRSIATQPWYERASTRDVMSINMADGNNFPRNPGRSQYIPNTHRHGDG